MAKWKQGQSGNPKGRPKGLKEKWPREFFRDLVLGAVTQAKKKVHKRLVSNLDLPERVKETLELGAKLNREIGVEALAAPPGVTIIFTSKGLEPEDFRKRALARDAGKPEAEVLEE